MNTYIVVITDVYDGYPSYYGPFSDHDSAKIWAQASGKENWEVECLKNSNERKCIHGRGKTDYCEPCGRVYGGP